MFALLSKSTLFNNIHLFKKSSKVLFHSHYNKYTAVLISAAVGIDTWNLLWIIISSAF